AARTAGVRTSGGSAVIVSPSWSASLTPNDLSVSRSSRRVIGSSLASDDRVAEDSVRCRRLAVGRCDPQFGSLRFSISNREGGLSRLAGNALRLGLPLARDVVPSAPCP